MRIGILSGGTGWHVQDLLRAATQQGHEVQLVDFRSLTTRTADPDCYLIRTMPAGSLEQIIFRMDFLHWAATRGVKIFNSPKAVETCVDKFLTDVRLQQAGLPVPVTMVCQRADDAMIAFEELARDVVVKPLFGSEGRGMMRISDRELAWRSFRCLEQTGSVLYLQQFIHHPGWDFRAFVLGEKVLASMRRIAHNDWRTNVAQGGTTEQVQLPEALQNMAIHAAQAVGCDFAGVDLLPGPSGEWYVLEVNGVPGWRALSEACKLDVAANIIQYVTR